MSKFSNGRRGVPVLEVTDDFVRLGPKTWSTGMIREVKIGPAGSEFGFVVAATWGGIIGLLTAAAAVMTLGQRQFGAFVVGLVIALLCWAWIYSAYDRSKSLRVSIKTGSLFVPVYTDRVHADAHEVKDAIEAAIARRTPLTGTIHSATASKTQGNRII